MKRSDAAPIGAKRVTSHDSALELTPRELARFLRRIALIYNDPTYGNVAVGRALLRLADAVASDAVRPASDDKAKIRRGSRVIAGNFRDLSREEVLVKLAEVDLPKRELLDIAVHRFSVPRSRLQRLTIAQVRDAIESALRHEGSLDIISEQAGRQGAERRS